MSFVITIGRQYGSGGRFIGKKLAELLGVNFYDNELITTAATQSGLSKAVLDNYDEKIWDGDLYCTDMYYYSKNLKMNNSKE